MAGETFCEVERGDNLLCGNRVGCLFDCKKCKVPRSQFGIDKKKLESFTSMSENILGLPDREKRDDRFNAARQIMYRSCP